jgi:outer membrane immunogenic protein
LGAAATAVSRLFLAAVAAAVRLALAALEALRLARAGAAGLSRNRLAAPPRFLLRAPASPPRPAADPTKPFTPYSYSDFYRFNNNANGVIGGAHVGYNYQINQFVLGLEGDVDGSSLSKTVNFAPFSNYYQDYIPTTVHSNLGVQGSIRGRLGYAFDRVLVYATGGVAFGGFSTSISTVYTNALFYPAFFRRDSFSNTRVGWTVGGGLEYAVTNNWSSRAEYRYTDCGPSNNVLVNSFPGFNGDFLGASVHTNLIENRVQVGLSYKFDTAAPAPVVAKY